MVASAGAGGGVGGGGGGLVRPGGARLDAAVVRGAVDIAAVAQRMLGIALERADNGELQGLCPLHDDHNPSFRINGTKQAWFCNSTCGGGDVLSLVQRVQQVDFLTALRRVAEFAGLGGLAVSTAGGEHGAGDGPDPAEVARLDLRARQAEAEKERFAEVKRQRAIKVARRVWGMAKQHPDHPHVRAYLSARGIDPAGLPGGKLPASVGFVLELPLPQKDQPEGVGTAGGPPAVVCPAMVLRWTARGVDAEGKPLPAVRAVQRVYLDPAEPRKAAEVGGVKLADAKVTLGSVGGGGAVKLNKAKADQGVTLWLCEGPETGLALLELVGTLPGGWATNEVWCLVAAPQLRKLSARKIPEAELGRRVARVVIAADYDRSKAGQKAAAKGAATLADDAVADGLALEVAVALPDHAVAPGLVDADGRIVQGKSVDWLDVRRELGVQAAASALAAAADRGGVVGKPPTLDRGLVDAGGGGVEEVPDAGGWDGAEGGGGDGGGGDGDGVNGWDEDRTEDGHPILPGDRTLRARCLLRSRFRAEAGGAWTLAHFSEKFWKYDQDAAGARWREMPDSEVEALATAAFAPFVELKRKRFKPAALSSEGVRGVLRAGVYYVGSPFGAEIPRWLPAAAGPDGLPSWVSPLERPSESTGPVPGEIIAVANGLLSVDAWLEGRVDLLPHSSRWFSRACLPFPVNVEQLARVVEADGEDQEALVRELCPQWHAFLSQTFGPESGCVDALQRWFGYCLTADARYQKLLLMPGPGGSGKGTIREVLSAVVGEVNTHTAMMEELAGRFDVAPMVGRSVLFVPEIHELASHQRGPALARLKSITGGDPQKVEEKHRAKGAPVRITAKFVITPNELPHFDDASGALLRRLLVVPTLKPADKPDPMLGQRLKREAAGVLVWALVGLRRLRRGGFVQPAEGAELLRSLDLDLSPVRAFVDEHCVVQDESAVRCDVLLAGFNSWAARNGLHPWSMQKFGRQLRAMALGVQRDKRSDSEMSSGGKCWRYHGIRPREHGEDAECPRPPAWWDSTDAFPGPSWREGSPATEAAM